MSASAAGAELRDFWLWQLNDEKQVTSMAHARSGRVDFRESDNRLILTLREVSAETRDRDLPENFSRPQPVGNSDSMTVELKLDGVFKQMKLNEKIGWLTLDQLLARKAALVVKGEAATPAERREISRVDVTLSSKAAASFAVLALCVGGGAARYQSVAQRDLGEPRHRGGARVGVLLFGRVDRAGGEQARAVGPSSGCGCRRWFTWRRGFGCFVRVG